MEELRNPHRARRFAVWSGCVMAIVLAIGGASQVVGAAGLNNQAYSFGSVTRGPVIGNGPGSVYVNSQITGERPKNLFLGPNGEVFAIVRGPGHTALVRDSAGVLSAAPQGFNSPFGFSGSGQLSPWFHAAAFGFGVGGGGDFLDGITTDAIISSWASPDGEQMAFYFPPSANTALDQWIMQLYLQAGQQAPTAGR